MLKQIMIPMAAFAFTVTGASAFTGNHAWWENSNVDLTDQQVSALEEAQNLRETAQEKAKTVLEDVGIDQEKLDSLREAARKARQAHHEDVEAAVEAGDYQAFLSAVADTPMADVIDTEAKFEKFAEAHELMQSGDVDGAREIMDELGLQKPGDVMGNRMGHSEGHKGGDGMRGDFSGPGQN